jgi:predicted nucleic-acid-binding protein
MHGSQRLKKNFYLIDTNVVIRFLTKDHEELSEKSAEIFKKIEKGEIRAKITESVLAEIVYVIMKIYGKDREFTAKIIKKILGLKGIVNRDKTQLKKALNIFVNQKVDIVDALLLSRAKQCLGILSFDKDIKR